MTTVSKMGPMIVEEPANAQGSKAKPADRVRAAQSKQSERQSDTRGGQKLALFEASSRGHGALKLCI
jgi:hypothetical protein